MTPLPRLAILSLALVLWLGTSCGGDARPHTTVALSLTEWAISAEPQEVQAGEVQFQLVNSGDRAHNLVIVKSDLPPGELPTANGVVDIARLNHVGTSGSILPGEQRLDSAAYSIDLTPGKYVLLCDVVEADQSHYRNGMHVSFFVNP